MNWIKITDRFPVPMKTVLVRFCDGDINGVALACYSGLSKCFYIVANPATSGNGFLQKKKKLEGITHFAYITEPDLEHKQKEGK